MAERILYYSEYGAVGDGVADDFDAIIKTHEAANEAGVKVCADNDAVYYIGSAAKTACVQTDTDWGNAKFIIDDSQVTVENRHNHIFKITSKLSELSGLDLNIKKLAKNQAKLELSLDCDLFVTVTDRNTMRYIREGPNQDNGSPQTDIFIINKNGTIDLNTPIIWDYNNITEITAEPIDAQVLSITGGHFTTVANQAESKYTYYARGIAVRRSNVIIDGLEHEITGELENGAPYGGFINISGCAGITVQNCKLSGHKTYVTIGSANTPVTMGSYDISVNKSANIIFKNCEQINDIHDNKIWGIFGSNYCKNITFDTVKFSRFDAHMGVANAVIKNSTLGYMGINLIGSGTFTVENTKICGYSLINLRSDYGSTWEGDIIIKDCEFIPRNGAVTDAVLIGGSYSGQHDFGYTCYMPRKISIDGLVIDDSNHPENYKGPKIFGEFNKLYTSAEYKEKYPYIITEEVSIKNLSAKSGKPYYLSDNLYMFRNVTLK